ncbi:MAG: PadR family transcriptional regulator [Phycisphaerales bacterium]
MARVSESELECFVLGLVWERGPASAYDIRRLMQDSPSTQWSGSAGAIYPLMKRLEQAKLLKGRDRRAGRRKRREYEVTARGTAVLRRWVGPPLSAAAISVAHDPLRSRARFLEALPPAARGEWVAAARAALDRVEERVRDWERRYGSVGGDGRVQARMTRSGELDVRSRREWLEDVARVVS